MGFYPATDERLIIALLRSRFRNFGSR